MDVLSERSENSLELSAMPNCYFETSVLWSGFAPRVAVHLSEEQRNSSASRPSLDDDSLRTLRSGERTEIERRSEEFTDERYGSSISIGDCQSTAIWSHPNAPINSANLDNSTPDFSSSFSPVRWTFRWHQTFDCRSEVWTIEFHKFQATKAGNSL